MISKDFILARNSGITPVKLLFDKSLKFGRDQNELKFMCFEATMIILTSFPDGLAFEFQFLWFPLALLKTSFCLCVEIPTETSEICS